MFLTPIVTCNKITALMLKMRLKDEMKAPLFTIAKRRKHPNIY